MNIINDNSITYYILWQVVSDVGYVSNGLELMKGLREVENGFWEISNTLKNLN